MKFGRLLEPRLGFRFLAHLMMGQSQKGPVRQVAVPVDDRQSFFQPLDRLLRRFCAQMQSPSAYRCEPDSGGKVDRMFSTIGIKRLASSGSDGPTAHSHASEAAVDGASSLCVKVATNVVPLARYVSASPLRNSASEYWCQRDRAQTSCSAEQIHHARPVLLASNLIRIR